MFITAKLWENQNDFSLAIHEYVGGCHRRRHPTMPTLVTSKLRVATMLKIPPGVVGRFLLMENYLDEDGKLNWFVHRESQGLRPDLAISDMTRHRCRQDMPK